MCRLVILHIIKSGAQGMYIVCQNMYRTKLLLGCELMLYELLLDLPQYNNTHLSIASTSIRTSIYIYINQHSMIPDQLYSVYVDVTSSRIIYKGICNL